MKNKVKMFINDNKLISNEIIICATSGGVDSVCLINILYKLKYKIVLAHVNHNKRKESIIEQEEMFNLAKSLDIPFELLDYHYDGNDNFHNHSHNARYSFFKNLCDKYNTNVIATAHHLDDQIETILIKLMEGSNLYGYGGISICNDDGKYRIIRPLLCVNKEELYQYAKDNNLKYFEDSSNMEDDFLRNRIRHNIIPKLKEESDDIYTKVLQYSIQVKEAFHYIRSQSIEYLDNVNNIINLDTFEYLDIAVKKDVISLLLERYNIRKNYNIVNTLLSILSSNEGTKILSLENNYIFVRSYNNAYIKKEYISSNKEQILNLNDVIIFDDKYKFYFSKNIPTNNANYIKLCYNDIVLPFKVRTRVSGDSISLNVGNKKVSRVFVDYKISKDIRDNIPIILDGENNIIWVYNYVKSNKIYNYKKNGDIYLVCEEVNYDGK